MVTITIENNHKIAGKQLGIKIESNFSITKDIPSILTCNDPIIQNTIDLIMSDNESLSLVSKKINCPLFCPEPLEVEQLPLTQIKPLVNGTNIFFDAVFTIPPNASRYSLFTIKDTLHETLIFDPDNTKISTSEGNSIPFLYTTLGNTTFITFSNNVSINCNVITVRIATILNDISLIPENLVIENTLTLNINGICNSSCSGVVTVTFTHPAPLHSKAEGSIISSISRIENSLSSIIPAENARFDKIISLSEDPEVTSQANKKFK